MMWTAAAIASQVAGFEILRRSKRRRAVHLIGWSLFCLSGVLFAQAFGLEPGIAWSLASLGVVGYGVILNRFFVATHIGIDKRKGRFDRAPVREVTGIHLWERLTAAGPLYLLVALGLALNLGTKLPWDDVNRMMFGALMIPLLWSIGALHATFDVQRGRIWGIPLALIALSAALFFLF